MPPQTLALGTGSAVVRPSKRSRRQSDSPPADDDHVQAAKHARYVADFHEVSQTADLVEESNTRNSVDISQLLPDDILELVLLALPMRQVVRCARVSRRWYWLVYPSVDL